MADDKLQQKLIDYVEDAHAMEQNGSTMLTSMISTTDDPEIKEMLKHHKQQTEEHERRLRERLDVMGTGTSTRKQAQKTIATALMKGVGDMARTNKAGKNARDGFVTEHMKIASYELLERLAKRRRRWRAKTAPTSRRWHRREIPTGIGSWSSRWRRRAFWPSKHRSRLIGPGLSGSGHSFLQSFMGLFSDKSPRALRGPAPMRTGPRRSAALVAVLSPHHDHADTTPYFYPGPSENYPSWHFGE